MKENACDKFRRIATWLDYQDENFNEKLTSVEMIEKMFDACERKALNSRTIWTGKTKKMRNTSLQLK